LEDQEREEIEAFNLNPAESTFSAKMRASLEFGRDKILASAKRNAKR
jgi:hypothetical protein